MTSRTQKGFSAVISIIAIVLVVGVLGFIGWRIYNQPSMRIDNATSNSQNTSQSPTPASSANTPAQTIDPTAGWPAYTSQAGNLTFKYPSTWKIDPTVGDPVYGKGSVIQLTTTSTEGSFSMDIDITDKPGTSTPFNTYGNGTTQQLTNGITLWQEKQSINYATGPATATCPTMQIGTDNSYSMKLKNGKYLSVYGSFCPAQNATTSTSYQSQINSQPWQDAINIIKSITFN